MANLEAGPPETAPIDFLGSPLVVVTADIDWASDACIDHLVSAMNDLSIVPTLFATHASARLSQLVAEGRAEIGVHPNFFPGSSHGSSEGEVLDHITGLFPAARISRSHGYFEHSRIAPMLLERQIQDDSNLCLFLQPNIVPVDHWSGVRKWPVFWEDDIHWTVFGPDKWSVDDSFKYFTAPGLKIIDLHPFNFAFNIDRTESYLKLKHLTQSADADVIAEQRVPGPGSQTFVVELLGRLAAAGVPTATFSRLIAETPR